ncbi:MAG TPA: hypothetical protein VK447_04815 [Myxococcaceae bacterium]|nr:hypothetical protein [Myxococcaceae bacterium]
MTRRFAPLLAVGLIAGCTAVNTATLPSGGGGRELFVLTGDLKQPYESVGLLQVTRKGAIIFGFGDPAGTDLNAALQDVYPQVRQMGGDGIINIRFHQTQYSVPTRVLFAVLFFVPLPADVTITGEVVRLRRNAPPRPPGEGMSL